jgi:hypothetical protein
MTQTQYYSTNGAQWHSLDFQAEEHAKSLANQNYKPHEVARQVMNNNLPQRVNVLAQILSPTGQVHVHHTTAKKLASFPQSVSWLFPEKAE